MNDKTVTWRQYEAGKEYKRRIGLYENTRRNERYYRGDQWYGSAVPDLPKPVFNVIKRIVDYLVCAVVGGNVSVFYTDEDLPFAESSAEREKLAHATEILSKHAAYRWENSKLDDVIYKLALDAAISGDGVLYCWWDPDIRTNQPYTGDIVTERLDNVNLFVADVNKPDIQSQEYVIISGRASVDSLRREAAKYGATEACIRKILPDNEYGDGSGDYSEIELDGEDKATYLIKFFRENGQVIFEKSTRESIIRRVDTGMRHYPVAYFNWAPTKNCFHGTSPVTSLIPNQKYINRAYAMVMKHMTDTAFSKIIYDKTKIPEWTNEVGEAIAAVGGGNIADAVSVVGVGSMQNGYLDLIGNAVTLTKELTGATETALGNANPSNTSAILAVQNTSRASLMQVRSAFCRCLEELASIWAEMILCRYPDDRLIPFEDNGEKKAERVELSRLKNALLNAHIEVGNIDRTTPVTTQNILDKLLSLNKISAKTYISMLPAGVVQNRDKLLTSVKDDAEENKEE